VENFQRTQSTYRDQDEGSLTWTVADILGHYNAGVFGIPHFQRGLVWDDAMLGALLESLYFDRPCGTIVLWKPHAQGLRDYGLPIGPHAANGEIRYLLVDGQQRVRSLGKVSGLLEALRDHEGNEDPATACGEVQRDESTGEPQVWCVNLARTSQFQNLISQERELPLFLLRVDPGHPRYDHSTRRVLPYNVIPVRELAMFKDLPSWDRPEIYLSKDLLAGERDSEKGLCEVRNVLRAIPTRQFFVRILNDVEFPDVVRIYNRINSAGKRVEAEERALATVSALDPKTYRRLRDMFAAVHPLDGDSHDALHERDELLRRQRERTLGFKFLMRAFVQACAQHGQLSADAAALSFDIVDRESFRKAFAGADEQSRQKVWDSATRAVACVARVLRNELCCDDFRFVPDAASLTPVMQLLIRFPDLAGNPSQSSPQPHDVVVAALILRAFLEGPRDPYKAAEWVRRSNRPLRRIVDRLRGGHAGLTADKKRLVDRLAQSNSLQDRYVLLLYWLIRRNRARDFSYRNLGGERPDREPGCNGHQPGEERRVQASERPEKQHIIPFSKIASIVDDAPSRARHGSANNIGNLTYISSALNSFDTGLGDRLIDPSLEGEVEGDNLRAHMLLADGEGNPIEEYNRVKEVFKSENSDRKTAESPFRDFCAKRRALVAQAFLTWLEELDSRRVLLDDVRPNFPGSSGGSPSAWTTGYEPSSGERSHQTCDLRTSSSDWWSASTPGRCSGFGERVAKTRIRAPLVSGCMSAARLRVTANTRRGATSVH